VNMASFHESGDHGETWSDGWVSDMGWGDEKGEAGFPRRGVAATHRREGSSRYYLHDQPFA
jgi:hypothetical protein